MKVFKQNLLAEKKLKDEMGASRENLSRQVYQRIKLLCQVFDDPEFKAEQRDDSAAADFLDQRVSDIGQPFLDPPGSLSGKS